MSFVVKVNPKNVSFKPMQTVGPVTFGEVDGKAAFTTVTPLGEEWITILPVLSIAVGAIVWLVGASMWWWLSSDLKFADTSKLIGLINPVWGMTAEALQR